MTIDQTILRYIEAWSTTAESERLALLDQCWADDGVYSDPRTRVVGRNELARYIAEFQRTRPGFRIPVASGVDSHHGYARFRWVMLDPAGQVVSDGFDIAEVAPDGRLQRITGFFGPFPAVPEEWPGDLAYRGD